MARKSKTLTAAEKIFAQGAEWIERPECEGCSLTEIFEAADYAASGDRELIAAFVAGVNSLMADGHKIVMV